MNIANHAAVAYASLHTLKCKPMSSAGTQWEKTSRIASDLSLTWKVSLAKALVPVFHCLLHLASLHLIATAIFCTKFLN